MTNSKYEAEQKRLEIERRIHELMCSQRISDSADKYAHLIPPRDSFFPKSDEYVTQGFPFNAK